MTGIALYQLSSEYIALMQKLDTLDLDAQTIADTIEASGLPEAIHAKAQGVEIVAREAEKYVPMIDMEIERLKALKASRERVAAGLRDYLKRNMEAASIDKIECPLFKIAIQKNPASVDIFEAGLLPDAYMVTPEPPPAKPNKTAIAADLKAGKDVPGARLVQGTRIVVK